MVKNYLVNSREKTAHLFGLPDIAIILGCACWGLNFVITRSAAGYDPEQFRPFIYNLIRFPAAIVLLVLTSWLMGQSIFIGGRDLRRIAFLAFIGILLYQAFYINGQTLTDSSNVGIVYGSVPILILIISFITRVEKPTIFMVVGIFLGFIGLLIVIFRGRSLSPDYGSLLVFGASLCWAIYAVLGKPVVDRYPPLAVTIWMLVFGTIYQLPLAIWQMQDQSWSALARSSIWYVALSAFLSIYVGYAMFFYAIHRLGPVKTGVYTNLTPVFTLIFAALLRGENITMIQIFGLATIILGIGISKIRPIGTIS